MWDMAETAGRELNTRLTNPAFADPKSTVCKEGLAYSRLHRRCTYPWPSPSRRPTSSALLRARAASSESIKPVKPQSPNRLTLGTYPPALLPADDAGKGSPGCVELGEGIELQASGLWRILAGKRKTAEQVRPDFEPGKTAPVSGQATASPLNRQPSPGA
jgi:hypothetical protein